MAGRSERLDELAGELGGATVIAADLLDEATPALVAQRVDRQGRAPGNLFFPVNNAGVGRRGSFAEGGWAEVHRVMAINFDAQVRLTEALLPLLRRSVHRAGWSTSAASPGGCRGPGTGRTRPATPPWPAGPRRWRWRRRATASTSAWSSPVRGHRGLPVGGTMARP